MPLLDFQTSLARLVRAPGSALPDQALTADERDYLKGLAENPAFRFTVKVQRSWCAGRAAKAAYLTLSVLPGKKRDQLLEEWVNAGGGTRSFTGAESADFLAFIARSLPDPSHELTICNMELAALRSSEGAQDFESPDVSALDRPNCILRRGRFAGIVHFYGEPQRVLNALAKGEPCPAVSAETTSLIFGPGFDRLYRSASRTELALFERLKAPVAAATLFDEGFSRDTVQILLSGGVVEYAHALAQQR